MSRFPASFPLSPRPTNADELNYLYSRAFLPFKANTGTKYPITQEELNYHRKSMFASRNKGPFVSAMQVTSDMVHQNDTHRMISKREKYACDRLLHVVHQYEKGYEYGPDLAVKAFDDLDVVFFGGYLRGNVCVGWSACGRDKRFKCDGGRKCVLGFEQPTGWRSGQTRITLNAALIFGREVDNPFGTMMSTILHEMCHAIDTVRSPKARIGHGEHFQTRISVVHKKAVRIFGLTAIDRGEPFMQHHWFRSADGRGGHWGCGERDHRGARHAQHCQHHPTAVPLRTIRKDGRGLYNEVRSKGENKVQRDVEVGCVVM